MSTKTVKRVDRLTKEQEAQFKPYADKWVEIGLRTGETDWETFDTFMPICYEKAGLAYPKNVVRVKSPLVGALASAVAEAILKKKRKGDAVRDAVGDAVRDAVKTASWHYWLGGQFWVGYWYWGVAFVNFFFDICKLKLSKDIMERAAAYRKVCESVNYIWPNRDFVMVCERPVEINRNAEGRLHSLTGMSIRYSDGYGLYHVHGVKFTEEQFMKAKDADVKTLLGWDDIEQRSALLRDKPLEQMLKDAKAAVIDKTDEEGGYTLWEIDLGLRSKAKAMTYDGWSKGADGKSKPYAKFVPTDSKNCLETIASLRGLTVEEFKNAVKS